MGHSDWPGTTVINGRVEAVQVRNMALRILLLSIEFTATWRPVIGLPMPATTDSDHKRPYQVLDCLRLTTDNRILCTSNSSSFGFQLPRGSFGSRRNGRGVRPVPDAGNGLTRSRWSLWRAAFLSGGQEAEGQGAYRSRDHVAFLLPSDPTSSFVGYADSQQPECDTPSSALRFSRRLSESLPPGHPNEVARAEVSSCTAAPF